MAEEVVELSVEETNRLRVSLGLKPLSAGPPAAAKLKPKPEPKPEVDAEELRSKLHDAREKRRRDAELRKTKTLGAADADIDDVASWISKIKPGQPPAGAADAAAAGGKPAKRPRRDAAAAAGEDAEHSAADLAGMVVRHDLGDMAEGETVVLTLEDAEILDEKGELADGPDQLVDVLSKQEKARRKARAAATKTAKPLWEEDGKVRGLLDKYDEEEEEAVAAFDAAGQLQAQQRRQEELRKRLAAGNALLSPADGPASAGGVPASSSDYYTAEEAAAKQGSGKEKKKKKSRKLRTTKVSADEGAEAAGGLDLDALEAAAAADGAADLGSREAREQRRQQGEAARAAAQADRAARFDAALGRANIASEALRPGRAAAAAADDGSDEADDELAVSLARARRLAQRAAGGSEAAAAAAGGSEAAAAAGDGDAGSSLHDIAKQLAQKREEDEAKLREQIAAGTVEAFTETSEFVRSIQVTGPKAAEDGSSYMDVDEPAAAAVAAAAAPPPPLPEEAKLPAAAKQQRKYRKGGWVAADGQEEDEQQGEADAAAAAAANRRPAPELEDTGVVGERAIGKGLAACLGLLKDKGSLKAKTQWAGRTNDKKPVALIGLHDVYTGGSHEDAMSQRIEVALTQRDEFGRVMTPKERFRVMCHQFHGKPPSKNKQEERQRKYLEEVAIAKATTSENPSAELDRLKELQRTTGSAYIPLTGKGRLGSGGSRGEDPLSGLATARSGSGGASVAPTPVLGGGLTPLAGSRKVEAMLGISKPGAGSSGKGSMLPPAPRR